LKAAHNQNFRPTQTGVSINFDAYNETGVDKEIVVNDANTFKALPFVLHVTLPYLTVSFIKPLCHTCCLMLAKALPTDER
jgi:hypothetical protein